MDLAYDRVEDFLLDLCPDGMPHHRCDAKARDGFDCVVYLALNVALKWLPVADFVE